jgi:hypothetical protein
MSMAYTGISTVFKASMENERDNQTILKAPLRQPHDVKFETPCIKAAALSRNIGISAKSLNKSIPKGRRFLIISKSKVKYF